ncbi:unnamed protein product, partial [Chrysoparadoxa australica]
LQGAAFSKERQAIEQADRDALKEVSDAFKNMENVVLDKDYYSVRGALRTPPISNTRRSMRDAITYLDEGATRDKAEHEYKSLIDAIQKLDYAALQGTRSKGGSGDNGLSKAY